MEKIITTTYTTTYETLGELTDKTEQIWLVCHGYGQLAKYFIRRFDVLAAETTYVIAPQGLSKFYLHNAYEKVGASWLTKEKREMDLANALCYLKQLYTCEIIPHLQTCKQVPKINLWGFSQGVSMLWRWAVACQIPFDKLINWAGRFPHELQREQLAFVKPSAEIVLVIGTQDEFYQQSYVDEETQKIYNVLKMPKVVTFDGGHELRRDVLMQIL